MFPTCTHTLCDAQGRLRKLTLLVGVAPCETREAHARLEPPRPRSRVSDAHILATIEMKVSMYSVPAMHVELSINGFLVCFAVF